MKQTKEKFDIERSKAILVRQLYKESFYGVLGIHPKASEEDIENGLKRRLRELAKSDRNLSKNGQLAITLKAYSILTSGYKNIYDGYLESYRKGLEEAVELFHSNGVPVEKLARYIQPWATRIQPWSIKMQPWSVFMQPWTTSNKKVSMQPWATGK